MIQGFSEQTKPLTDYEDKVILPLIVQGLHLWRSAQSPYPKV